jgi:hypothetical protein
LNGEDEPGTIETEEFSVCAIETGIENNVKKSDIMKKICSSNLLELSKREFNLAGIFLIGI